MYDMNLDYNIEQICKVENTIVLNEKIITINYHQSAINYIKSLLYIVRKELSLTTDIKHLKEQISLKFPKEFVDEMKQMFSAKRNTEFTTCVNICVLTVVSKINRCVLHKTANLSYSTIYAHDVKQAITQDKILSVIFQLEYADDKLPISIVKIIGNSMVKLTYNLTLEGCAGLLLFSKYLYSTCINQFLLCGAELTINDLFCYDVTRFYKQDIISEGNYFTLMLGNKMYKFTTRDFLDGMGIISSWLNIDYKSYCCNLVSYSCHEGKTIEVPCEFI